MGNIKYSVYGILVESNIVPPYYEKCLIKEMPILQIKHVSVDQKHVMGGGRVLTLCNKDVYGALELYCDQTGRLYVIHSQVPEQYLMVEHNKILFYNKNDCQKMEGYQWGMIDPLAFSLYFRLKSKLVIHGSALIDNETGLATLLIAASGSGKSTLSSFLMQTGRYSIISDDTIIISKEDNSYKVYKGFPYVRLYPTVIEEVLQQSASQFSKVHSKSEKRIVPFSSFNSNTGAVEAIRIGQMIYVEKSSNQSSELCKLLPTMGIKCITKEMLFNNMLTSDMLLGQWRLLYEMVNNGIPIYKLDYVHRREELSRVIELISSKKLM